MTRPDALLSLSLKSAGRRKTQQGRQCDPGGRAQLPARGRRGRRIGYARHHGLSAARCASGLHETSMPLDASQYSVLPAVNGNYANW